VTIGANAEASMARLVTSTATTKLVSRRDGLGVYFRVPRNAALGFRVVRTT
jgi:hypothetical protein